MHFNFAFYANQIFWTLTFASQLILLVVLLGRDRARRYPWFTASIVLFALRLMAEVLLGGRMAPVPLNEILLTLGILGSIASLLVVAEVAWQAFAGAPRSHWIGNMVGLLLVAGGILAFWSPWPAKKDLALDTLLGKLKLMQLVSVKIDMLGYLLIVAVGLMVIFFGRRYKAAWRSHTQMIAIGLSTVAIAWIAKQALVQSIVATAHPATRQEYGQILNLLTHLSYANNAVYIAALVWWIVWLWRDEPGAAATKTEEEQLSPSVE